MTDVIRGPSILTADGEYFDYENPDPRHFTLNAIAQGLANTCRFAGQCKSFYSVAEHSVHVSHLVPPEFALHALLHDAAEALIGDIPTPLKRLLPDFREVEHRVEKVLFEEYGLPETIPDEVKHADRLMLEIERRALFNRHDPWEETEGLEVPARTLFHFDPRESRNYFINRAKTLGVRGRYFYERGQ